MNITKQAEKNSTDISKGSIQADKKPAADKKQISSIESLEIAEEGMKKIIKHIPPQFREEKQQALKLKSALLIARINAGD